MKDVEIINIDIKIKKVTVFYFLWTPMFMSKYNSVKNYFKDKDVDMKYGMIESPRMIGFGFLGHKSDNGDYVIRGSFNKYVMNGPYTNFKNVWKMIMANYKNIVEAYHVYKTDVCEVPESEYVTEILWR